jgi:hypothetical protein
MHSKIESFFIKRDSDKICQGDILRDYVLPIWIVNEKGERIPVGLTLPYIVVLTQDCDLDEDFDNRTKVPITKHDKFLQSILVCPVYLADKLKTGKHLEDLSLEMEYFDTKRWNTIKINQNPRYHFIRGIQQFQFPDCVIDFKHYYTIQRDLIYKNFKSHYIGTVNVLFREQLSQRFAYHLSRIGLPVLTHPNVIQCEKDE